MNKERPFCSEREKRTPTLTPNTKFDNYYVMYQQKIDETMSKSLCPAADELKMDSIANIIVLLLSKVCVCLQLQTWCMVKNKKMTQQFA